jgi:hypothetical protein
MAITNFIPTVWSETLYTALDRQYIGVRNCTRDYEGAIREAGDTVKIVGVGEVNVQPYKKNTDMSEPETLSDTVRTMVINQAQYFNFQIDDVDRAQAMPSLMQEAMKVAASALANVADKYVFGLYEHAGNTLMMDEIDSNNILDILIAARQVLYENNVSDSSDVVIEVSPAVASVLLKAKIVMGTDNAAALENGCLGSVAGCAVFVSPNVATVDMGGAPHYQCLVRTRRAIAFAEQLSEIDAYRPERRFADAVKGLHLYGAKVVYPNEMVCLDLALA